jgi:hypothetical protein
MLSIQIHEDIKNSVHSSCFLASDPKRITLQFNFVKNPERLEQI